jgi:hypothetical protein
VTTCECHLTFYIQCKVAFVLVLLRLLSNTHCGSVIPSSGIRSKRKPLFMLPFCVSLHVVTDWSIVSWQLTDDELTFTPRATEAAPATKPRAKTRTSHASSVVKQAPSPVVPTPAPTFAVHDSDSDVGARDDDGEYTGERQLTRLRRGRQVSTCHDIKRSSQ